MRIRCQGFQGFVRDATVCDREAEVVVMYRHHPGSLYCRKHGEEICRRLNPQSGPPLYWLGKLQREETT